MLEACRRKLRRRHPRKGAVVNDWRFRTNWLGHLILQRRVRDLQMVGPMVEPTMRWRDATVEDLTIYSREMMEWRGK